MATADLIAGEVVLTGVGVGETEVTVEVSNEAGTIEVTVPISVVGADPLTPAVPGSTVILNETFETATAENFWKADYKSIPGDPSKPMYYAAPDQVSKITFSDGKMTLANGRFAIGQTDPKSTSSDDEVINGSFDLSRNWKIQIRIISGSGGGKFQVQVDNNTTSDSNSKHGKSSRIYSEPANGLNDTTITISSDVKGSFTTNSFLFLRTEGGATAVIDQVLVETWD